MRLVVLFIQMGNVWTRGRYGGAWGTLDHGVVELNKPLGLPNEVQEAGGSQSPTTMGGVSAEDISFTVIDIKNSG